MQKLLRITLTLTGLLTLALSAVAATAEPPAASPAPAATPAGLTPERTLDRRFPGDLQVAAGSGRSAFTVSEPPKEHGPTRHVWVLDAKSRELRQFTHSEKSEWNPRWSPDGRALAFLSSRTDPTQIWILATDGGEALPLTSGKAAVTAFEWSPDGKRIAYLAAEPKDEAQEKKEKDKDDAKVADRDDRPERLWLVDVPPPGSAAAPAKQLTRAPWKFSEMRWTPDGQRLIALATDQPASDQWTDRIVSVAVDNGLVTALAAPVGPLGDLRLSPDGRSLAYVAARKDGPAPHDLFLQPLAPAADSKPRNLTAQSLDRGIEGYEWRPDGTLTVLVESGFRSRFYHLDTAGAASPLPETPVEPAGFALLPGDDLVFAGDRTAKAPEIWLWPHEKAPERVTNLNASWAGVPVAVPEMFRYKSFDGQEIEAALLKPSGFAAGRRVPLVVLVHGGPTGRWRDRFEAWGQLLCAKGYAVLYPNVRGSSGYGFRFLESNRADWGGGDFKDVLAGVDAAIAKGVADPDRLGIGGWSYGGYMSAWAITQTHRFKAAVAGAGLSDLASEFGTEDGPAYD
ncbi:MAG TPA: S9 family peptidase, partial [Thermoanaerobaculia bacterium]